jgi:hypothetical protein
MDEHRCGHLRDHVAMIAEGGEEAVLSLMRVAEIAQRTKHLQQTAVAVEQAIQSLREQYRQQQRETRSILQTFNEHLTKQLFLLGLSEAQEQQLEALFDTETDRLLDLFHHGMDFDTQLHNLIQILNT